MVKRLVMAAVVLSFSASIFAAKISEGFEDKAALKKWEIEGSAVISADQKHGGNSSLFVPNGATATWRFATENKFGTVTMWVYDSFAVKKAKGAAGGPYFGLINGDDDKAVEIIHFAPYLNINYYSNVFTAENQWYSQGYSGIARPKAAWGKFTFTFTDAKTLSVSYNDDKEDSAFPTKLEFFNKGANGVVFAGGPSLGATNETFYYDDIEVDLVDAPKAK